MLRREALVYLCADLFEHGTIHVAREHVTQVRHYLALNQISFTVTENVAFCSKRSTPVIDRIDLKAS